ncbi:MAG: hypothetical protein ACI9UJ_001806, partial [bacterium]
DTNTQAKNKIFAKTIKITPTTNNTSASVKIAMYYTNAEYSGWKTATGEFGKDVQLFKTTNAVGSSTVAQGTVPSATTTDSLFNGDDLCIIGTFANGFSGVGGGGGAGGGGGPLPVSWLNFDGMRSPTIVTLSWSTASEINNDKFEILRSTNSGPFESIGVVRGGGNSVNRNDYKYIDNGTLIRNSNTLCYQLKQIDFDGQFDMSKTICLESSAVRPDIILGPNPFVHQIEIAVNPWSSNTYGLEIFDLEGNIVYVDNHLKNSHERIDLKHLAAGVYFVAVLRDGQRIKVHKLIKQL